MQNDAAIAALLGSRICHDLISPIGAINNGLELLGMTGAAKGPEMDLISESVTNASARIKYFRIAFGAASDQEIGAQEVSAILQDSMGGGRLKLDYAVATAQPRAQVRLVFLAVMCLEIAMPYGGQILINESDGKWTLTGTAPKLNAAEDLWSLLAAPATATNVEPAHVQFALLPVFARAAERRLGCQIEAGRITLTL